MTVNVAFLRSGRQFAAKPGTPPPASSPAVGSKHARLESFYARMLAARAAVAVAAAKPTNGAARRSSSGSVPTLVNLAFLRSGGEFKPATAATAVARTCTPERQRRSKYQRLESFYGRMLGARTTATATATAATTAAAAPSLKAAATASTTTATASTTPAPAPTLVHPRREFLWTDDALTGTAAAPGTPGSKRLTRHQRLQRFHAQTLAAAAAAEPTPWTTTASTALPTPAPTLLHPRREFLWAYDALTTPTTVVPSSPRSARRTRYQKLEQFYNQTLSARAPGSTPGPAVVPVSPAVMVTAVAAVEAAAQIPTA